MASRYQSAIIINNLTIHNYKHLFQQKVHRWHLKRTPVKHSCNSVTWMSRAHPTHLSQYLTGVYSASPSPGSDVSTQAQLVSAWTHSLIMSAREPVCAISLGARRSIIGLLQRNVNEMYDSLFVCIDCDTSLCFHQSLSARPDLLLPKVWMWCWFNLVNRTLET